MSVIVVSRHPAVLDWMRRQGLRVDQHVAQLGDAIYSAGDCVVGPLPAHLAAEVCERGAEYWHIALDVPAGKRGAELSADDMGQCHARLVRFVVSRVPGGFGDSHDDQA